MTDKEIVDCAEAGLTEKEIASFAGITQPRVNQILKKMGFERNYLPKGKKIYKFGTSEAKLNALLHNTQDSVDYIF